MRGRNLSTLMDGMPLKVKKRRVIILATQRDWLCVDKGYGPELTQLTFLSETACFNGIHLGEQAEGTEHNISDRGNVLDCFVLRLAW